MLVIWKVYISFVFFILFTSGQVISQDNSNLVGIPENFDSEYHRDGDYPYYTLEQLLTLFYSKKQSDKKVSVIGYISRDTTFLLKPDELLLQRYFVTCCIAHAKPVSVYLITENPGIMINDEWVKVNGYLVEHTNKWGKSPALKAERIESIPKPQKPYLNCNACPNNH